MKEEWVIFVYKGDEFCSSYLMNIKLGARITLEIEDIYFTDSDIESIVKKPLKAVREEEGEEGMPKKVFLEDDE